MNADPEQPETGSIPPEAVPDLQSWSTDGLEQLEAALVEAGSEVEPEPVQAAAPDRPRSLTPPPEAAPPPLLRVVEALLFVGGVPLTAARAGELIRGLSPDEFQRTLDELGRVYRRQNRPYAIRRQDQGFVLDLRPRFAGVRERLFGSVREARLSQAAVDVLALVAWRQPVTRQDIDALRGGDSAGVLRQLVRLGLVAIRRQEAGDVYVTTPRFLQLFRLKSLEDLPRMQDLQQL